MRVVHKTGTSEGIKSAVGDFFDAAQGGKKAKASALKGAQKLIGSSIDGLLGTGSGSSNECSEFVVVFMNYSFVRIDYMAYYYNVEGKGILKSGQQGGFCSIMDVSIIPHEQIRNEEITYLLSQALHMEPGESSFEKDLKVLMTLEVLLAEERLLTRKMNDETTTLEDIRRMKDQLNNIKGDQISAFDSLPDADLPDIMVRIDAYNALSDGQRNLEDSRIEAALDAYVAGYMQQLTDGKTKATAKTEAKKKLDSALSVKKESGGVTKNVVPS